MAPSAFSGRRAADGLEVSHGGTVAQRPWRTNWARNRGDRNCLWPFQAWASVRPEHPSGLGIRQTEPSPGQSDSLAETQRRPRRRGEMTSRDFSRLLASFRVLASLAVFVFSSFLRASVRKPEPDRRLHRSSPTRFPEGRKNETSPVQKHRAGFYISSSSWRPSSPVTR